MAKNQNQNQNQKTKTAEELNKEAEATKNNLVTAINETAQKIDTAILNIYEAKAIKTEYNAFKQSLMQFIDLYTKQATEATEDGNNEEETATKTRKATDASIIREELEARQATYKQQAKERQDAFKELVGSIHFELTQENNNYILKAFTNSDIIEQLRPFVDIKVFDEDESGTKTELKHSNNQVKKALNFALHTALKKSYSTILDDKTNNKKEKRLDDYKVDYSKLYNTFNEKLLFEYYIIREDGNKKELARNATK